MPYKFFSRLRGSFRQGILRTNIALEGSLQESLGVLLDHGKLLFGKPRFYSGPFVESVDLNILLQRFTPCAAQLNLLPASKKKNLSVIGAVSQTFSIPSVSGPSFQVCEYHADNLLSGPSHFPCGISNHKMPMALSSSKALLGGGSVNNSTVTRGNLIGSFDSSNISYKSFHSCGKISMNSRNKEQSESLSLYGYFIYHVTKTSGNCNQFLGFQWKSFHVSVPTFLTAGAASDVFSNNRVNDGQLTNSADSSDK